MSRCYGFVSGALEYPGEATVNFWAVIPQIKGERHCSPCLCLGGGGRNGKLRDELLNREIFTTLEEAKVLIEQWRREYNQVRPHSALRYRPPAPEAILIMT